MTCRALIRIEPRTEAGRIGLGREQRVFAGVCARLRVAADVADGLQLIEAVLTLGKQKQLFLSQWCNRVCNGAARSRKAAAHAWVPLREAWRGKHRRQYHQRDQSP